MPRGEEVSAGVAERTLLADFGPKLGGKMQGLTSILAYFPAWVSYSDARNKMIYEGPLLDLLMEYRVLESRIH